MACRRSRSTIVPIPPETTVSQPESTRRDSSAPPEPEPRPAEPVPIRPDPTGSAEPGVGGGGALVGGGASGGGGGGGDGGGSLFDDDVEELPRMTLIQHLEELRGRILRSLLALAVGFGVCFFFAKQIFRFLERPILRYLPEGKKLVFLQVTDPFVLYMKVAALAGLFLALPYILYQVWRFIAPGLYRHEKRYSGPFIFFGSLFFLLGGVFAYYIAFPYAVQFLINVGEDFEPAITGPSYLSFLLTVILGMSLMFELPIFIFALASIGVVSPRTLMRQFRWAVLIIVIVAAVITPTPDAFTLSVFAVPTIALYLIGVAAAALVQAQRDDESGLFITRVSITTLAAVHLAAAIWHGRAHDLLGVTLPPEKNLFVITVIVVLPALAAIVVWTRVMRTAVWTFTLSMLAALVFGVYHHYLTISPDHVAHLPAGDPRAQAWFVWSAATIAGLEGLSALYGALRIAALHRRPR
jgi:sec-independent protein translocase protein TatC